MFWRLEGRGQPAAARARGVARSDLVLTGASTTTPAQLHDGGRNPSGVPRPNVTMHDLRHTFGVHCAQAGVPIVRLQKLLGHASPHMTLRYMKHAPESYFAEDAARVASSLSGHRDQESEAQARLVRDGWRRA